MKEFRSTSENPANPFSPERPVSPRLFAGRSEAMTLFTDKMKDARREQRSQIMLITGPRAAGKSSLLRRLSENAEPKNSIGQDGSSAMFARIRSDRLKDPHAELSQLVDHLKERILKTTSIYSKWDWLRFQWFRLAHMLEIRTQYIKIRKNESPSDLEEFFVQRANATRGLTGSVLIVAIDEADQVFREHPALISVFRDLHENSDLAIPVVFLFIGLPSVCEVIRTSTEASFLRNLEKISLKPLSETEVRSFVNGAIEFSQQSSDIKIEFDEVAVDLVVRDSGGHPGLVQRLCKNAFDVATSQLDQNVSVKIGESEVERGAFAAKEIISNDTFPLWAKDVTKEQGNRMIQLATEPAANCSEIDSQLLELGFVTFSQEGRIEIISQLHKEWLQQQPSQ